MAIEGMEHVRTSLPAILARFRSDPYGHVVHFGRHRRDEAVVMSAAAYERLQAAAGQLDELDRLGAVQLVRERLAAGRFSEGTVDDLFAAADAER